MQRGPVDPARPAPPEDLADPMRYPERFAPAPELAGWVRSTFVSVDGALFNEEHFHLEFADVLFLWTNAENIRNGRAVVGTAEIPGQVPGGKWAKARARQQLREWFGGNGKADFLVTVDAVYASLIPDAAFCALVEHELYHCGQALDEWGGPKFTRDGAPVFAIRGHDAEEFVGVVRRYGAGNAAGGVAELVEAANHPPEVAPAEIAGACGVCLRAS